MGDRHQETEEGYYVQNGDVLEWRWKDEPKEAEPEKKPAAKPAAKRGRPKKEDS